MTGFGEIGQNGHFWAIMAIFGQFLGQNGENEIFQEKAKMSLPYAYIMLQLCARNQNKPMDGF